MMKRKNNKRGFTIIELTIVVAVIAILSAVLIPTFSSVTKKARQSADETAVRNLNTLIVSADDEINDRATLINHLQNHDIDLENYLPMSKNYSFVYSVENNVVMLLDLKTNKVVFPAEYADVTTYIVLASEEGAVKVVEERTDAVANASQGGTIAFDTAMDVETVITVTKPLVVDINANLSLPNDTDGSGVFEVKKGGKLTLNGNGTVNGKGNNDYNMALWANGGDIVINGGNYTNVGCGDQDHYDLIYVKNGGKVTINGGTFQCQTPKSTLNINDDKPGSIVIAGGSFFNFDPSNLPEFVAHDDITLAEGFKVVAEPVEGTSDVWYKVVPDTNA